MTAEARQAAEGHAFDAEDFRANTGPFSFDEQFFKRIRTHRELYPKQEPNKYHQAPLRWEAYLMCNSFDALAKSWLTAFAPVGSLQRSVNGEHTLGIVIESCEYFCLVWNSTPLGEAEKGLYSFMPRSAQSPTAMVLIGEDEYNNFEATETVGTSPWQVSRLVPGSYQLALREKGTPMALAKLSATRGFAGISTTLLQKLFLHLKLEDDMPDKEEALVRKLIRACWPDISEEELEKFLHNRAFAKRACGESPLLDPENEHLLEEAHGQEEDEDMKQDLRKERRKRMRKPEHDEEDEPGDPDPEPPKPLDSPKPEEFDPPPADDPPMPPPDGKPPNKLGTKSVATEDDGFQVTLAWARKLLPPAATIKLDWDLNRYQRFKLYYPSTWTDQKYYHTLFTKGVTKLEACKTILREAWRIFTDEPGGYECPFDIEQLPHRSDHPSAAAAAASWRRLGIVRRSLVEVRIGVSIIKDKA